MVNSAQFGDYSSRLRDKAAKGIDGRIPTQPIGARTQDLSAISRAASSYRSTPGEIGTDKNPFSEALNNVLNWKPVKLTLKTLDTPGSFVRGAVDDVIDTAQGKDDGDSILSSAAKNTSNLWNDEKTVYGQDMVRELLNQEGPENEDFTDKVGQGVLGFAADVALDPLSYLGIGLLGRGANAAGKAAQHGTPKSAQRVAGAVQDTYKEGGNVNDILARTRNRDSSVPVRGGDSKVAESVKAPVKAPAAVAAPSRELVTTPSTNNVADATYYGRYSDYADDIVEADVDELEGLAGTAAREADDIIKVKAAVVEPKALPGGLSSVGREMVHTPTPRDMVPWRSPLADDLAPSADSIFNAKRPFIADQLPEVFRKAPKTAKPKPAMAPAPSAVQVEKTQEALSAIIAPVRGTPGWTKAYEKWASNPASVKQTTRKVNIQIKPDGAVQGSKRAPQTFSIEVADFLRYSNGEMGLKDIAEKYGIAKTRTNIDQLNLAYGKVTEAYFDKFVLPRAAHKAQQTADAAKDSVPSAPPQADRMAPTAADPTEGGRWVTELSGQNTLPDGYMTLNRREWDKARKKIDRRVKQGWIRPVDAAALKDARNSMNPNEWDRVIRDIMYEGQPSPITPVVREVAETVTTPQVMKEAVEQVAPKVKEAKKKMADTAAKVESPATSPDVPTITEVRGADIMEDIPPEYRGRFLESLAAIHFREWGQLDNYTKPTRIKGTKVWTENEIGRNRYGFNAYSQYTWFKSTMDKFVGPILKGDNAKIKSNFQMEMENLIAAGRLDAEKMYNIKSDWVRQAYVKDQLVLPIMQAQERYLKQFGIIPSLGSRYSGKPLSLVDIMESLPPGMRREIFFNPTNNIAITNIEDAVNILMDKATDFYKGFMANGSLPLKADWDRFSATIAGSKRYKDLAQDTTTWNALKQELLKQPGFKAAGKNTVLDLKPDYIKYLNGQRVATGKAALTSAEWSESLVESALRRIVLHADDMFNRMITNAAKYNGDVFAETNAISGEWVENFGKSLLDPAGTFTQHYDAVTRAEKFIDDLGKEMGAHAESKLRAAEKTEDWVEANVDPRIVDAVESADEVIKATDNAANAAKPADKAAAASTAAKAQAKKQFDETAKATSGDKMPDPKGDIFDAAKGIDNYLDRKSSRFFELFAKNTWGMPTIGDAVTRFRNIVRPQRAYYHNVVAGAEKTHGKELFNEAFYAIQRGDTLGSAQAQAAMKDVEQLVSPFFGTQKGGDAISFLTRDGYDWDLINAGYAKAAVENPGAGLDNAAIDIEKAVKAVEAGEFDDLAEAVGSQWRSWDIDDPAVFLKTTETILTHQMTMQATIYQGLHYAQQGGYLRTKPTPGFVKYVNTSREGGVVNAYLPPNTYISRDVVQEFAQMDKVLQQTLMPNSEFGRFVRGPMGTIMAMWKSGMTIWNPRHYFRNGVGDISLNWLAGVKDPTAYADALKVMTARGDYGFFDGQAALQSAGQVIKGGSKDTGRWAKNPGGIVFNVHGRGNTRFPVSAEEIYKNLRARGVLNSYPVREQLFDDMVDAATLEKWQERFALTGGRVKNVVVKTHEQRDHFIRLAHAIDVMKKGKFNSLDEAYEAAAKEVMKWHPDGSNLSQFQNKYLRPVFPFYSWTRGALPLVVESMVTRPGRFMTYPRAYQNVAMSMGIEMDSIADPFPEDQLFPEFMTDRMTGPLFRNEHGNYIGIHPGAVQDDLTQFAENPARATMSMLSPFIKAPIELATGTNLGIGAPVMDTSDYVDSQIPGVNVAANMTGNSPSGSLKNALTFDKTFNEQTGEFTVNDPQRSVRQGVNEPSLDVINWLLGLQAQNMSQSNYQNLAEFNLRDKTAKELRRLQRDAQ